MNRNTLISYAMNFASFLLDSRIKGEINKIILFGSVARGNFTKNSDIDIFIDTNINEKKISKLLKLFKISEIHNKWELKGIKNEISIKVGDLEKWKLKRDIISTGILLYGKYNQLPEKIKYYLMIKTDMKKMKPSKQMSIWRKLYGYKQKTKSKTYIGKGLVEKSGGKKIGRSIFLIPMENRNKILGFLNKNKVNYIVNEVWSDIF